jgi:hypothetical protein
MREKLKGTRNPFVVWSTEVRPSDHDEESGLRHVVDSI